MCVPELKIQLQSSFEVDESVPEENVSPDTPVAPIPDQQGEPSYAQEPTPTNDNPLPVGLGDPLDMVLSTKCPLSEQLRDLRRETFGCSSFFFFSLLFRFLLILMQDVGQMQFYLEKQIKAI